MNIKLSLIAIIFVLGLLYCFNNTSKEAIENFETINKLDIANECPNLLIQKGNKLHLIYKNKAKIPGVNPLVFNNLEEYVEFLDWQRSKGIKCPVLYFQKTYDAQNNSGYRMMPDVIEKQGGLSSFAPPQAQMQPLYDSNHDDPPYNKNSYPGFDADDQNIGVYTPLDRDFHSNEEKSANAMDLQWGGLEYSDDQVNKGKFNDDYRQGYDNPYVSKSQNQEYQNRLAYNTIGRKKSGKVTKQSPEIKQEIRSRYGGDLVNNPMSRALIRPGKGEISK